VSDQRELVRRGYDELAADYAAAREPDGRDAVLLDALRDRLSPGARVLDAGCGDGRPVLTRAPGWADVGCDSTSEPADPHGSPAPDRTPPPPVVGVDLSREQCRLARERTVERAGREGDDGPDRDDAGASPAVVRAEMTRLPVVDDAVDAVTAFHSVIHVPIEDHETVYREFARVLRPGGWLLCSAGDDAWIGRTDDWLDSGTAMAWSFPDRSETIDAMRAAGFVVEERFVADDLLDDETWTVLLARLENCRD
jgi:SAM-dependent methyltransferase